MTDIPPQFDPSGPSHCDAAEPVHGHTAIATAVEVRADGAQDGTRVCVGFATRGRPVILGAVVDLLAQQTHVTQSVVLSCTKEDDVGPLIDRPGVVTLIGPAGSARQRNLVLDAVSDSADIVAFFDDDFVPSPTWVEAVVRLFREQPDIGAVTGHVLADGIKGPGIPFEEACRIVAAHRAPEQPWCLEQYPPYGCNMAFRLSALRELRFDERLVLYGWLEDRDLGASLLRRNWRVVKTSTAFGVHMGIKVSRAPGRQLGYSQVMNPVYMHGKGTMAIGDATRHIARNIAANAARAFMPEPHVDRFGRLKGNLLACMDIARGRRTPERAQAL